MLAKRQTWLPKASIKRDFGVLSVSQNAPQAAPNSGSSALMLCYGRNDGKT